MDSLRMRLGPVDSATLLALGKSIVAGKDVGRHSPRHEFTCNRGQHMVASGTSRQRNHSRVEPEASDSFAQLTPDGVVLDEKNAGRGSKAFVAGHQDSVV